MLIALVAVACAEPPTKEFHQAEGAVQAARAAGAAVYAPESLANAERELQRYDTAVAQRDYRLALNHALTAREQAERAASEAGTRKAALLSETERLLMRLAADLETGRRYAASATRAQAADARALRSLIPEVEKALQETRALLEQDDVPAARARLDGLQARLAQALAPFGGA